MKEIVSNGLEKIAADMIIATIKSVARHNKRAAYMVDKSNSWIKELHEHNSFLSDLVNILSPVVGLIKGVIEATFPGYVHIAEWVISLITDVANGLA